MAGFLPVPSGQWPAGTGGSPVLPTPNSEFGLKRKQFDKSQCPQIHLKTRASKINPHRQSPKTAKDHIALSFRRRTRCLAASSGVFGRRRPITSPNPSSVVMMICKSGIMHSMETSLFFIPVQRARDEADARLGARAPDQHPHQPRRRARGNHPGDPESFAVGGWFRRRRRGR